MVVLFKDFSVFSLQVTNAIVDENFNPGLALNGLS